MHITYNYATKTALDVPHLVVHYLSTKRRIHIISEILVPSRTFSREQPQCELSHENNILLVSFTVHLCSAKGSAFLTRSPQLMDTLRFLCALLAVPRAGRTLTASE